MKLLINVAGNIGGGSMQVAISFINECAAIDDNQYVVVLSPNIAPYIDHTKFSENFTFVFVERMRFYQQHKRLSKIENKYAPDVVFTVFGPAYWRPKAPHLIGFAVAHHLNPESPFWSMVSWKERMKWVAKIAIQKRYLFWECDAIVGETKDVEQRSHKYFGGKKQCFTVSNTCNGVFYEPQNQTISAKLPLRKENELRLLTLSKYYRHKNFELYPHIIDMLHSQGYDNIKFITTLATVDYQRIFGDKYLDTAINVGPIPIWECPALYKECDAMFLPTMLESFSASYPEAMLMGKPILTSHYGFATSICDDAAIYFDPTNVDDIATKIVLLANDKNLRELIIENGRRVVSNIPSAKDRATAYLQICNSLVQK